MKKSGRKPAFFRFAAGAFLKKTAPKAKLILFFSDERRGFYHTEIKFFKKIPDFL